MLHLVDLQRVDLGQVLLGDGALNAREFLHALQEIAHVILGGVHLNELFFQPSQLVDRLQRGAYRSFDGEHHIAGYFHKLAHESQVGAAFGYHAGTVGAGAGHELAGDVGHHAGGDVGMGQHFVLDVQHVEVVQDLQQDLFTGAVGHGLFDVITRALAEQTVAPQHVLIVGALVGEVVTVVQHQADLPAGILHRDDAAGAAGAAGHPLQPLEEFGIVLDSDEVAHPLGLVDLAQELFGVAELCIAFGQVAPDVEQTQILGVADGFGNVGIVAETGVGHQRTAGHEHIVLAVHGDDRVLAVQLGFDAVHGVAGIVHDQIIDGTAVLEVNTLVLQPDHNGLDDGIILVALGVQDAFQIIDAVGQAEAGQIALGFQRAVVGLERQHGMEAPPHGGFKEGAVLAEVIFDGQVFQLFFRLGQESLQPGGGGGVHAVIMHILPDVAPLDQAAAFGMDGGFPVHVHRFVQNAAARGVQRRNLAAQVPQTFHIGFKLPLAGADVSTLGAHDAAAAAHVAALFVDGDVLAGHACIINQKDSRRQACNAAAHDMGFAFLDALGFVGAIECAVNIHNGTPFRKLCRSRSTEEK